MFRIFGSSESESELRTTNKALLKQLKAADVRIENLETELEDQQHETYRSHENYVRDLQEERADAEHRAERRTAERIEEIQEAADERVEEAEAKFEKQLEDKDTQIAELQSQIRTLELAAEEESLDVDLQVQEGINEYKEEHQEEVTSLQVKLATSEGQTKTAQAETKSKDAIIAVLTTQLESRGEDVESMIDFAKSVAPKVSLDKFQINVEVPAPVTVQQKGGGDQQQKKQ